MKLLILTQYFPPEVGAPQNRLYELAVRLVKQGVEVSVLTAMPNYPKMEIHEGYRNKKYVYEESLGIKIHRSSIYVSKSKSIIHRLRNYFSFVISSMFRTGKIKGDIDFLMCESPPLFLGYSAMYIAWRKKARLIFNVSDLWPESAEKLGVVTNKTMLKMAYNLEAKLYRRSALVTGQTQGICKNISKRFPNVKTYWLPNGVDLDYYDPSIINGLDWRKQNGFQQEDFLFLYAGIIGIAQGLEIILQSANDFKQNKRLKFILMGSGPEKERLQIMKTEMKLENVFFMEPVPKTKMPAVLKSIDAAIVPLKKLEIFKGAIPSKLFENLAMEIPVLLGVDGEARELFINKGKCGLYFEPENPNELSKTISAISSDPVLAKGLGKNGRKFANEFFNRDNIARSFYSELKKLNESR